MRIVLEIPLPLSDVLLHINSSSTLKSNPTLYAISTSSKEISPGDLFIALDGENFSGEDFITEAKEKGAYILSARNYNADIVVKNTSLALLEIAAYYKKLLKNLKYTIAITGSVGKTTTKNILSEILSYDYTVSSTIENYNNIIGVSYTILSAKADTEILVLELGMNHIGEISALSKAISPDAAIITNIGTSHIGNLGSRELIAKAKLEISDGMNNRNLIVPYGEALLNPEDKYTFSTENKNASCYIEILKNDTDKSIFNLKSNNVKLHQQKITLPGRHILSLLAAAIGVIDLLNIELKSVAESISKLNESNARGKYISFDNFRIYDDSYSSSYESVISDFELLSIDKSANRSCVLGDMLELGGETEALHRKIGEAAYKYGFRVIYTFGAYSSFILHGAVNAGMPRECIYVNEDITKPEITAEQIIKNHRENETILIKASNKLKAGRIVDFLKKIIYK